MEDQPRDYSGPPYWKWAEEAEQLRKAGNLAEAEAIWLRVLDALEQRHAREGWDAVPYTYYERLAMIYRSQKRYADELAVLDRYLARSSSQPARRAVQRLNRVRQLLGQPPVMDESPDQAEREIAAAAVPFTPGPELSEPEHAAFIDVETTGLDPSYDQVIEMAVVLFAFRRSTGEILGIVDTYTGLQEPTVPISPDAQRVHGISIRQVRGKRLDRQRIAAMIDRADILIAHNAAFDRRFVERLFPEAVGKPWYCSMRGIDWAGKGFPSKGLQQLLRDHHIHPGRAHRALDDAKAAVLLLGLGSPEPYLKELLGSGPIRAHRPGRKQGNPRPSQRVVGDVRVRPRSATATSGCLGVFIVAVIALLLLVAVW